jgi:S-formylglutathione hydrolase FrmB
MKRKLIFLAAALAVLTACGTSSTKDNDPWGNIDPADAAKQSSTGEGVIKSNAMNREMTYSIWLPAGYDKTKKYPFLYLLHGYEDANQSARHDRCWLDKGNAAYLADSYQKKGGVPMVIIMPNGLDKFYVSDGYEKYFEEELVPEVEKKFNGNGKRAIAGLSMGGFGTFYHAIKYHEKFLYAYAMSPATNYTWGNPQIIMADLFAQQDKTVFPKFSIEVGTEDFTVSNADSKALYNKMEQAGIKCEYISRAGTHNWEFWQECLPKALDKVGQSFK